MSPESVKPLFAKTRLEAMGGELYIQTHALDHSIGDGHQMVASVNSTKKKRKHDEGKEKAILQITCTTTEVFNP